MLFFFNACLLEAGFTIICGESNTSVDWLELVFQQCRGDKIHIVGKICWMAWKCRNDLVWNQQSMKVKEVIESAKSVINQW